MSGGGVTQAPSGEGEGEIDGDGADGPAQGDAGAGGATAAPASPSRSATPGSRRWMIALLAICALGLGIRLAYVFGSRDFDQVAGDAYYYHAAANLLAEGEGFVHPYFWDEGIRAPGADHPPAYQVVLALPSLLGFDTIRAHQVFTCLLGAAAVGLVGLAGRQVAGARAGLIAAAVAALYPNVWMNDAALMSETLAMLCGTLVVIAAYAAWRRPDPRGFALTGAAVGVATLARAEAALLLPLVVLPLAVWVPGLAGWRPRLRALVVGGGVALAVVLPWVAYNMARFAEPATLSTQMGPTLDVANCDDTYYGRLLGSWSFACATDPDLAINDRSTIDKQLRDEAITYARDHLDRVPLVVAARVGRAWAVYGPLEQLDFDRFAENRPLWASRLGLAAYYPIALGAVAGAVLLRRRGVPSFPLVAGIASVAITVVVFYGSTRFRAPAEPSLVLLAAVALDAVLPGRRTEGEAGPERGPEQGPEPAAAPA